MDIELRVATNRCDGVFCDERTMDIFDGSLDSDISPFSSCICECDDGDGIISQRDIIRDRDISTDYDDAAFRFFAGFSIELSRSDRMIPIHDQIIHIIIVGSVAREESSLFADRVDEIDTSTRSTTDSLT